MTDLDKAILETERCAKEVLAGRHRQPGGCLLGLTDWMAEECLIRLEAKLGK